MARKNLRQQTALKTKLRLTFIATTAAISGLVVLLIVVFNLTKKEEGRAATSMTYKQSTTFQDTSGVLRGSINQKVIGVLVETSGKGTPVKINSFTFSAAGTSIPIEQNIENARLWYTGNDPEFSIQQIVGTTIPTINDKPFVFSASQTLLPGKNFFWLTFDVFTNANSTPGTVDAMCKEIRIGAISYLPVVVDPIGKRFVQSNIPFYSMGNFSLGKVNSWNSKRDGSGMSPRQMNEVRNSYFIQSGHRMISSTGSNLQTLVIEKGGELRITSPLRLNAIYVAFGGVVQMDTSINDFYSFNEFYMDNGALYIHNSTGWFPGLKNRLSPKSTQLFFKYGSNTFRPEINFGNLVLDAVDVSSIDLGGKVEQIQGDFEIRKTGKDLSGIFFTGSNSLNIHGSFIQMGGLFFGATNGNLTCSVGQDFILKGGEFYDAKMDKTKQKAALKMHVKEDVILLSGIFTTDRSATSEFIMSGSGTSRWIQKPLCKANLGNVTVANNHVLQIKGEIFGNISKGSTFQISDGAELYCEKVVVNGEGEFVLENNTMLAIGHPEGIYSSGSKGNIQTEKRTFNSGATYYYYLNSNPQETGIFQTQPKQNVIGKLVVNKAGTSQVLNLSQNLVLESPCMITLGDIRSNGFELKVKEVISTAKLN
jgi:hypothetical protein